MVLPGHLAAGYLVTYAVLHAGGFNIPAHEIPWLLAIGTLLGDAPDSDLALTFFKKKTLSPAGTSGHRDYVTHTAIVWLVAGVAVYAAGIYAQSDLVKVLGLLLWLCPWSHLVCDSMVFGVRWLWPFSNKFYALTKDTRSPSSSWKEWFIYYATMPLAYIEIGLTIVAIVVFVHSL